MSCPRTHAFSLDTYVYSPIAVREAAILFKEYAEIELVENESSVVVSLQPKTDSGLALADEFLNYALNLSVERFLVEE